MERLLYVHTECNGIVTIIKEGDASHYAGKAILALATGGIGLFAQRKLLLICTSCGFEFGRSVWSYRLDEMMEQAIATNAIVVRKDTDDVPAYDRTEQHVQLKTVKTDREKTLETWPNAPKWALWVADSNDRATAQNQKRSR